MAESSEVQQLATQLRTQVQNAVHAALAQFGDHLALVIQTNPSASIDSLLARADVQSALTQALHQAEQAASAAVVRAGSLAGDGTGEYQDSLRKDVQDAYAAARGQLTHDVTAAFNAVPQEPAFVKGESPPGTNPVFHTAQARAHAVVLAVDSRSGDLSLRNGLSTNVAGSRSHTESVIAEAVARAASGEDVWLEWQSRRIPGVTCAWCWGLHGHRVRPGEEFPHPEQIGRRRPPRLYLGVLHGPPLHPNCACELVIVSGGPAPLNADAGSPATYLSSADIKALPEEGYRSLVSFVTAALHELGQILRRLVHFG